MPAQIGTSADDLFVSPLEHTDYDGREGSDTVDYRNAAGFVSVNLATNQGPFGDTYVSIENIRGSNFGDLLRGNAAANTLVGRGGTDTLSGGDGNDTLYSDATGTFDAGNERDLLDGGAGDDILWAGGDDFVNGDTGFDTLLLSYAGGPGTLDQLGNVRGYTILTGNMLSAPFGNFRNIEQVAYLWGSQFDDTIDIATQQGAITVEAGAGTDIVTAHDSAVTVYGQDGFDRLTGSTAGDLLSGGGAIDWITGRAGGDHLIGGDDQDIISAGEDRSFDNGSDVDRIDAGAGADQIYAGYGDIVDGGADFDRVYVSYIGASSGITNGDTASLFAGQPLMSGGGTLANVESFTTMALTAFDDRMVVGNQEARPIVYGWDGNDTLIAQQTDVLFYGGNGNDLLVGGTRNDVLVGDAGDDILIGGERNDHLDGGAGRDRYIFINVDSFIDSLSFEQGDTIDLSSIDADTNAAGDQAFVFIGAASFSGSAGELRAANEQGFGFFLSGDVDGDRVADFIIDLGQPVTFTNSDFML